MNKNQQKVIDTINNEINSWNEVKTEVDIFFLDDLQVKEIVDSQQVESIIDTLILIKNIQ